MKEIKLCIFFIMVLSLRAKSQSAAPIFIGFQPNITVEPFYENGEFDADIAPVVLEISVSKRMNIKIAPTVNYRIGGETEGVSDVGANVVLPFFFKAKENEADRPFGFYLGPVFGFGRNLIGDHYTTTLAVEPGYLFETKNRFTISMGLQLGATYFSYDAEPNKWRSHWGPKFSFGFWVD